jgi:gamma-D-glutamyl-L-lysine dipeptidyl-peptidase
MKNFYKRICCLFLLICTTTIVMPQTFSFKKLSQEMQILQKKLVPDKRTAILRVEIKDTLKPIVILTGETNLPGAREQIIRLLNDNKVSFIDSLRILPDSSLGDKIWALTALSVSNLRSRPEDISELVSQTLLGTPLKILDSVCGWYRVQTPEQYIGWMDTAGLQRIGQHEMDDWKKSNRYVFNRMTGLAFDAPDRKAEVVCDLVLDDIFVAETKVRGFLKISLPDGRIAYVRKKDCISWADWGNDQPQVRNIISVSKKLMGSPYMWGGASVKATDCSGFVKMVFYSQGLILARDASQQALYGDSIDFTNKNNLQAGDLIFFGCSAQHISHVGIYLGNGKFIHSSGRVHISSIIPGDMNYDRNRNNVAARRIMDARKTEGIVRVKAHPWYNFQP